MTDDLNRRDFLASDGGGTATVALAATDRAAADDERISANGWRSRRTSSLRPPADRSVGPVEDPDSQDDGGPRLTPGGGRHADPGRFFR